LISRGLENDGALALNTGGALCTALGVSASVSPSLYPVEELSVRRLAEDSRLVVEVVWTLDWCSMLLEPPALLTLLPMPPPPRRNRVLGIGFALALSWECWDSDDSTDT
jgi:hypothetical protein